MRIAIAAMVAAGLIATPAIAQDTNEANAAATTEAVEAASEENLLEPVPPITNEPVAIEPAAPVLDPRLDPDAAQARREDRGFPWGLIGLVGLVGLLGRRRG